MNELILNKNIVDKLLILWDVALALAFNSTVLVTRCIIQPGIATGKPLSLSLLADGFLFIITVVARIRLDPSTQS